MRFGLVARGFDPDEVLDLVAMLCDEVDELRARPVGRSHEDALAP